MELLKALYRIATHVNDSFYIAHHFTLSTSLYKHIHDVR